jgi:ankyrin repeat protein
MPKNWGKGYFINKNTVNVLDDRQFSWLHRACILDDFDTVIELIEQADADVNIQGNYGDTPLHYTVLYENQKITKYLLQAGADIYIKNEAGNTAVDEARKCKDYQILDLLYKYQAREIQNHEILNSSLTETGLIDYNQSDGYSLDSSSQSESDQSNYSNIETVSSGEGSCYSDSN